MKKLAILPALALLLVPAVAFANTYDGTVVEPENDGETYNVAATSGDSVTLNNVGDGTGDLEVTFSNGVSGSIQVTQSTTLPAEAPVPPTGTIDIYFDVDLNGLTNDDISGAVWSFSVTKAWLNENDVSAENVFLQHYTNGAWERLTTRVISETDTEVNLEADIDSFSPFAVTAVAGLSNTGSPFALGALLAAGILISLTVAFRMSRRPVRQEA